MLNRRHIVNWYVLLVGACVNGQVLDTKLNERAYVILLKQNVGKVLHGSVANRLTQALVDLRQGAHLIILLMLSLFINI